MANNYSKGRAFEYRVANYWKKKRWHVFRSAGSHSPIDLLIGKAGEVIAIQCQTDKYFAPGKVEQLRELAEEMGWQAMLFWTENRKMMSKILDVLR